MTKENRKIMRQRLSKMRTPHDMKNLKDPSSESLRGINDFVVLCGMVWCFIQNTERKQSKNRRRNA